MAGIVIGAGIVYGYAVSTPIGPRQTVTTTNFETTNLTQTTTFTVTLTPLAQVTVFGNYSTKSFDTYATGISFTSETTGITYPGVVTNGAYTISNLPNQDTYTVKINYNISPVGGGTCTAGTLVVSLEVGSGPISADWSC